MVYQTALLFNLQLPFALYFFVFSGSVCSYNFHWYLTPPHIPKTSSKLQWNLSNRNLHLTLFIAGMTGENEKIEKSFQQLLNSFQNDGIRLNIFASVTGSILNVHTNRQFAID